MSHLRLPAGVRAGEITTSRLTTHVLEAGSPSAPPLILVTATSRLPPSSLR
ncbi:MAG: hypothetical protein ACRDPO_02885 [Streptosporangiaceae bacterium]